MRERELTVFSEGNDNVGVYCLCQVEERERES